MPGTGRLELEGKMFQSEGTACAKTWSKSIAILWNRTSFVLPGAEKWLEMREI